MERHFAVLLLPEIVSSFLCICSIITVLLLSFSFSSIILYHRDYCTLFHTVHICHVLVSVRNCVAL